jgi:hypothetical protein
MPIFGQVWLWSLLAFLLGALLCWVWVVLPVRRRIDALERRLASSVRTESRPQPPVEQPLTVEPEYPRSSPGIVPGLDNQDEIPAESLTRAYALPGLDAPPETPNEAEERGAVRLRDEPAQGATAYLSSRGAPSAPLAPPAPPVPPPGAPVPPVPPPGAPASDRDWFDDVPESPRQGDHHLVDDHDDVEETGTIFTQRTMPIPAEAIRQLDESQPAHAVPEHADYDEPAHAAYEEPARGAFDEPAHAARQEPVVEPLADESLVDDLAEEDEEPALPATTYMPPPPPPPPVERRPEPATNILFTPNGTSTPVDEDEPLPAAKPQDDRIALVTKSPARSTLTESEPKVASSSITIQPESTPSALPKRIPSKPQHRVPFGVQTTSPATTATTTGSERMRSLFEPIVPAEGELAMPPPHRVATDSRPSAPGPFGPGSAMPLPGGASPSPEFTIKASVTALRYCTPESPQFGRTVAEVWFRSAADAERVGFRPVG